MGKKGKIFETEKWERKIFLSQIEIIASFQGKFRKLIFNNFFLFYQRTPKNFVSKNIVKPSVKG